MERFEGFREFVLARSRALSRTAYLLTGDHQLAEDLLQAALGRTAAHWHRIADTNPEAYLRRVMVNERTSWWRRQRYAVEVPTRPDVLVALVPSTGVGATDTADVVVGRAALNHALAQLPARQRAVVVLRYFDDLTEAQVAQALDCSIGTVKSQAHDALARLRALAPSLLADVSQPEVTP